MPSAFDRNASAATDTSRMGQQMGFDAPDLPFDLEDILDIWRKTIDDFLIPIFKELTGIDLSSPQAFILSLVQIISNGGNAVASFISAIVQPLIDMIVNALTGGNHIGNPIEMIQGLLGGLGNLVGAAIESANQATDIARQVMQYVVQIVQNIEDIPIFGDIFEAINSFAFWVLGWFGITRTSVTPSNPAYAGLEGRVSAMESANTVGLEGFNDHFNRTVLGTDWTTLTGVSPLSIVNGQYVASSTRRAGRYSAKTLVTDTWHVQAAIADLSVGKSRFFASCSQSTTESGFGSMVYLDLEHVVFPFNQGGNDTLRLCTVSGGMTDGTTRRSTTLDLGNIKNGDVLAIEYWQSDNTFYVFLNNNELTALRWTDSGNVVTHGVGHRDVALMTGVLNNGSFPGCGWDDLSAYDIKVA